MEFRKKYIRYLKQNKTQTKPKSSNKKNPTKKPHPILRHLHRAHHSCTATHKHRHNAILHSPQQSGHLQNRGWQIKNLNKTKWQKKKKSLFCAATYCRPYQNSRHGAGEVTAHKGEREGVQQHLHVGGGSASEYALAELWLTNSSRAAGFHAPY